MGLGGRVGVLQGIGWWRVWFCYVESPGGNLRGGFCCGVDSESRRCWG